MWGNYGWGVVWRFRTGIRECVTYKNADEEIY